MSNSVPKPTINEISFVGSFPNWKVAPKLALAEFAFIGRSNVGKSSLINFLSDRKDIAKTSSTPGKTQMINLFTVDDTWVLADLPGYGYARVSKKKRAKFSGMIETYLKRRENLATVFLLIDIRHDPQEADITQIEWLADKQIPFSIVFTKSDKIKKPEIEPKVEVYMSELDKILYDRPNVFVTSASDRSGSSEVLSYIHYVLEEWSEQS